MSLGGRGRYSRGTTEAQIIARASREYDRQSDYRKTKQIIRNTTPKETKTVTLENYEPVAVRLDRWLKDHPNTQVLTEMLTAPGADVCVMRATLIVDGEAVSTGHAEEVRNAGNVNRTSHVENCETSAIGRALANAGAAGSSLESRPSREEMTKVYNRPTPAPVQRKDDAGNALPLQIKGTQHGPIPQWALDAAAEQGIVLAYDNRDTLAANPKRPWFKCVESGAPLWAPKGTPLPTFEPEYDLSPEEPF
jgi:hypothetical protein